MWTVFALRAHDALHSARLGVLDVLLSGLAIDVILVLGLHLNAILLVGLLLLDALAHLGPLLFELDLLAVVVDQCVWVLFGVGAHGLEELVDLHELLFVFGDGLYLVDFVLDHVLTLKVEVLDQAVQEGITVIS